MKVYPRSAWTSYLPRETLHADRVDDLLYFTKSSVQGIMIHADLGPYPLLNRDPAAHFDAIRKDHVTRLGFSDIRYNLGVGPRDTGVWELRGLTNKGSGSDTPEFNNRFLHVYSQLGLDEKPTDAMIEALLNARKLVLSKYPNATKVVGHTGYHSKPVNCPGEYLQQVVESNIWDETVSDISEAYVPELTFSEGMETVHVFSLISFLNYLGYYSQKNSGKYDAGVRQAVRELQVDLKEGGFYKRSVDGQFGPYTRKGLGGLIQSLSRMD